MKIFGEGRLSPVSIGLAGSALQAAKPPSRIDTRFGPRLERPVHPGGRPEIEGMDAGGHHHDVTVLVDAEVADEGFQAGGLRQHEWHAVAGHAPAGLVVVAVHRARNVALGVGLGAAAIERRAVARTTRSGSARCCFSHSSTRAARRRRRAPDPPSPGQVPKQRQGGELWPARTKRATLLTSWETSRARSDDRGRRIDRYVEMEYSSTFLQGAGTKNNFVLRRQRQAAISSNLSAPRRMDGMPPRQRPPQRRAKTQVRPTLNLIFRLMKCRQLAPRTRLNPP